MCFCDEGFTGDGKVSCTGISFQAKHASFWRDDLWLYCCVNKPSDKHK